MSLKLGLAAVFGVAALAACQANELVPDTAYLNYQIGSDIYRIGQGYEPSVSDGSFEEIWRRNRDANWPVDKPVLASSVKLHLRPDLPAYNNLLIRPFVETDTMHVSEEPELQLAMIASTSLSEFVFIDNSPTWKPYRAELQAVLIGGGVVNLPVACSGDDGEVGTDPVRLKACVVAFRVPGGNIMFLNYFPGKKHETIREGFRTALTTLTEIRVSLNGDTNAAP